MSPCPFHTTITITPRAPPIRMYSWYVIEFIDRFCFFTMFIFVNVITSLSVCLWSRFGVYFIYLFQFNRFLNFDLNE